MTEPVNTSTNSSVKLLVEKNIDKRQNKTEKLKKKIKMSTIFLASPHPSLVTRSKKSHERRRRGEYSVKVLDATTPDEEEEEEERCCVSKAPPASSKAEVS